VLRKSLADFFQIEDVSGWVLPRLLLYILHVFNLVFLYLSRSQDSELSYAHRDGRLLELIDEAWQRDELPNDGMESFTVCL